MKYTPSEPVYRYVPKGWFVPVVGARECLCVDGEIRGYESVGQDEPSRLFDTREAAQATIDRYNAAQTRPTPAELRAALEAIVQAWEAIPNRIDPTPQKIHDAIKAGRKLLKGSTDA